MDGISAGAFITWAVSAPASARAPASPGASKASNRRLALSEKRETPPPPSGARRNRGQPRAQVRVIVKVERGAIAPPVPRENRVGMERDVILQPFADLGEQVLEHVAAWS
jgi:hypothetical protein